VRRRQLSPHERFKMLAAALLARAGEVIE